MKLAFTTDEGIGTQANLGLIVLKTDETIEYEFSKVINQTLGVALYCTRIANQETINAQTLKAMKKDLPKATSLLPNHINFKVIGYGCTSASSIIGNEGVQNQIQSVYPQALVTNPILAVVEGCKKLNAKKIGFITPYIADVSVAMRQVLEDNGLEIVSFGSFEEEKDPVVARISLNSTYKAIERINQQSIDLQNECDLVFVSCTNVRLLDIVQKAEQSINKPVISSNIALLWHIFQQAGIQANIENCGTLLSKI